ncbi:MAG: EthD domain-containing protein [Gammaproteobacteria bacterium]|nr:EthD domain-containing protein [Gammaproteobacteria bacterium]
MIRYINCFTKDPALSTQDFRAYWQSAEFDELIKKVAKFTSAVRYSKNLTLQVSMGEHLASDRGLAQPYDGIVEYYWESAQHLPNIYASGEGQALSEEAILYQSQFIDLANSTAFFTDYQS